MNEKQRTNVNMAIEIMKRPALIGVEKFDMCLWGFKEPNCGTSACFAGAMSLDPYFIEQGFKGVLKPMEYLSPDAPHDLELVLEETDLGYDWTEAIQSLFGITPDESSFLTMPESGDLDCKEFQDRTSKFWGDINAEDEEEEENPMPVNLNASKEDVIFRLERLLNRYA